MKARVFHAGTDMRMRCCCGSLLLQLALSYSGATLATPRKGEDLVALKAASYYLLLTTTDLLLTTDY